MRKTKQAFLWIIEILKENDIKYRISGGLSARVYGSKRKLADIDIEVRQKDVNKIYKSVKEFVVYGPKRYKDQHWDLMLMTLEYKKQEIDIASFEAKLFNKKTKQWINRPGKFNDSNLKNVFGLDVLVEKKRSLIKYKKILSRDVDIKDVKQLS